MSVEYVPLRYVTSVLARGTAPNYADDGQVRMVSQAANQDAGLDWERTRFHEFTGDPRKIKGHLQFGDSLVNSTGTGTLGRIGWFENAPDSRPCVADGHVTVVRFTSSRVDKRFGYYYLKSDEFQEFMFETLVNGSTNQIELSRERMSAVSMPTPPLEEQRRIADFLDAETARIDKLSSLRWSALEKLGERENAELDEAVQKLGEEYGYAPLRRFLLGGDQGSSPQCDAFPASENEWGVLKVSCLRPGRFIPEENKRLPDQGQVDFRNRVQEGDLLVTRANTPDLVGSTAVVPKVRGNLLLSDKIFRVHPDDRISSEYIAVVARGKRVREICSSVSNGASQSMANIRFEEVKAWPVPLAGRDEQLDLVDRVTRKMQWIDSLRATISRQRGLLAERRQALIAAAVTGQIDVSTASGRGIEE